MGQKLEEETEEGFDLSKAIGISKTQIARMLHRVDLKEIQRLCRYIKDELDIETLTVPPHPYDSWQSYNDRLGDPLWDCRIGCEEDHETLLRWERYAQQEEELNEDLRTIRSRIKKHWEIKARRGD